MMTKHSASFRDPAGFIFRDKEGGILRQINTAGAEDFDMLLQSGLYEALTKKHLLVAHETVAPIPKGAHALIKPQQIPFISYPFEWSFEQLQDAALLTLAIQKRALEHGMTLKDASAYNVQFLSGKPIFIDSLSFEKYTDRSPWKAYGQFCEHFLAPLALMAYTDASLSQLLRVHLDGIPLTLTVKLLPRKASLRPGLAMHLFMHARAKDKHARTQQAPNTKLKQEHLAAILDSLNRLITSLKPAHHKTEWGDYYDNNHNYTAHAHDQKAQIVQSFAEQLQAKTALDLGGNDGRYSRVLNELGIFTICTDSDPNAVARNYHIVKKQHEQQMLPLLVNLTNPGGAIGWHNQERTPIHERLQTDVVLALALVHHLSISNNLPFEKLAAYFSIFAPHLIIEFVPKQDSQVQKLLATRQDIFPDYHETAFKQAFSSHYKLVTESPIPDSKRTMYLFKRL